MCCPVCGVSIAGALLQATRVTVGKRTNGWEVAESWGFGVRRRKESENDRVLTLCLARASIPARARRLSSSRRMDDRDDLESSVVCVSRGEPPDGELGESPEREELLSLVEQSRKRVVPNKHEHRSWQSTERARAAQTAKRLRRKVDDLTEQKELAELQVQHVADHVPLVAKSFCEKVSLAPVSKSVMV